MDLRQDRADALSGAREGQGSRRGRCPTDKLDPADDARQLSEHRGAQERRGSIRSRRFRFRRGQGREQPVQAGRARREVRRRASWRSRPICRPSPIDKPYVLLPAVLVSRGQHHTIAYNAERGALEPVRPRRQAGRPPRLHGDHRRPGCAASWRSDYGVDLNTVEWITFEDPHVAEYRDPGYDQARAGRQGAGADAARRRDRRGGGRRQAARPAAEASHSRSRGRARNGGRRSTAACRSITWWWSAPSSRNHGPTSWRRCSACCARARTRRVRRRIPNRFGSASRPAARSLEVIIDYCHKQGLIPTPLSVDSLFDDVTRKLGA